jgi:hypothetical protein
MGCGIKKVRGDEDRQNIQSSQYPIAELLAQFRKRHQPRRIPMVEEKVGLKEKNLRLLCANYFNMKRESKK